MQTKVPNRLGNLTRQGNSERTIDAFLNEVTNPTEDSTSEQNGRTPKLSRDASLKSVEREKEYRTPVYGGSAGKGSGRGNDMSGVDEQGMEMRLRGSNNNVLDDMTDVDLGPTPNKEFQDTGASSTVSRKKKLNLRRPYAKANELGWRQRWVIWRAC